jgi:hypothetical protein
VNQNTVSGSLFIYKTKKPLETGKESRSGLGQVKSRGFTTMERRRARREKIVVDIEVARPGLGRCFGYAQNISRQGVSMILQQGTLPLHQQSVMLSFRIWTGSGDFFCKVYARVVRLDGREVALEFSEKDAITEATIQDLLYYQRSIRNKNQGKLRSHCTRTLSQ